MISPEQISEMSPVQLRKGYKAYTCCIKEEFSTDPVSFKNHPQIQQRKFVYNRAAIQEYFKLNGTICPQSRVDLSGDLGSFESLQLEQLLFALEVEKHLKALSEAAKKYEDINEMLKDIMSYLAGLRETKEDFVARGSETLSKLLRGDFCSDVSLDSVSRLASCGLEIEYNTYKAYVEKFKIQQGKAEQKPEQKEQKERQEQVDAAFHELDAKEARDLAFAIEASQKDAQAKALKDRQRATAGQLSGDREDRGDSKGDSKEAVEREATIIGTSADKKTIAAGETYEHVGDLTLNFVPEKACVVIKNGRLIVKGDVGEYAVIDVKKSAAADLSHIMKLSSMDHSYGTSFGDGRTSIVGVGGNVNVGKGGNLNVSVSGMAIVGGRGKVCNVIIEGNVKRGADINSADAIFCENIAEGCTLIAKGKIVCRNVGTGTTLSTSKDITASRVAAGAVLETINGGNTNVDSADDIDSLIASTSGKVFVGGRMVSKPSYDDDGDVIFGAGETFSKRAFR